MGEVEMWLVNPTSFGKTLRKVTKLWKSNQTNPLFFQKMCFFFMFKFSYVQRLKRSVVLLRLLVELMKMFYQLSSLKCSPCDWSISNVDFSQFAIIETKTTWIYLTIVCLFVRDFSPSTMNYLWIWQNYKCCDA